MSGVLKVDVVFYVTQALPLFEAQYVLLLNIVPGHQGSVNSIKFHPGQDLVITGSGDGTAHVWSLGSAVGQGGGFRHSSEEEGSDEEVEVDNIREGGEVPALMVLTGHTGVVVSADWVAGGNQAVTASWDRTAALWDLPTQTMIQALAGHDMELTGAACHPAHRLIVTSSKDSTFRLWDFRETIHSVSVFQGHTDSVTCAAFSRTEHIVSGSDDRTVKVCEISWLKISHSYSWFWLLGVGPEEHEGSPHQHPDRLCREQACHLRGRDGGRAAGQQAREHLRYRRQQVVATPKRVGQVSHEDGELSGVGGGGGGVEGQGEPLQRRLRQACHGVEGERQGGGVTSALAKRLLSEEIQKTLRKASESYELFLNHQLVFSQSV